MRKITGYVLIVLAMPICLLGLLFLIASQGIASRLITGFILLIIGSGICFVGAFLVKTAFSLTPNQILSSILNLAKVSNGYLTKEAIIAELGNYPQVDKAINDLLINQTALIDPGHIRTRYVFPDFLHDILIKACMYCSSEYPVRDPVQKCPQCGGDISLQKAKIEKSNEIFSLDEK